MNSDLKFTVYVCLALAFTSVGEAFFLRWGAEPTQSAAPKAWVPAQMAQMAQVAQAYRGYGYSPSVYEQRKVYPGQAYSTGEAMMQPIPISVPLQASLTPVSLQHVQLVPCMCPVAAEEADKLHEQAGAGPYLAQPAPPLQGDQQKQ